MKNWLRADEGTYQNAVDIALSHHTELNIYSNNNCMKINLRCTYLIYRVRGSASLDNCPCNVFFMCSISPDKIAWLNGNWFVIVDYYLVNECVWWARVKIFVGNWVPWLEADMFYNDIACATWPRGLLKMLAYNFLRNICIKHYLLSWVIQNYKLLYYMK